MGLVEWHAGKEIQGGNKMKLKKVVRVSDILEVWESYSGWYWYITEYHQGSEAYGVVHGFETEWGYFDLDELRELEKKGMVWQVPESNWLYCPGVVKGASSYSNEPRKIGRSRWRMESVKGGEQRMAEQVILCPTKSGHGYKIGVDGEWFYTSTENLLRMVNGRGRACTFRKIKQESLSG